jgi:effector-binding domain-containing protein
MSLHDAARAGCGGPPAGETLVMKGTCRLQFPGAASDKPMTGTIELYYDGPQALNVTDYGDAGLVRAGFDAGTVWETHPVSGVRLLHGAAAEAVRRSLSLFYWSRWTDFYRKADWVGTTTIEGRPHDTIRLTPALGDPDVWHLDAATHLPARVEISVPFNEKLIPIQVDVESWVEVKGRPYPRVEKVTSGGVVGVYEYHHVEPGAAIPPERFALPEEMFEALASQSAKGGGRRPFFQVQERKVQPAATVRAKVPPGQVARTAAETLPEIMAYLTEIGVHTEGGPFARYHAEDASGVDVEIGIPVTEPVPPRGRIAAAELPGGRVAMTWHLGPYESLAGVRRDLRGWIQDRGLSARGGVWEIYWSDPGRDSDPNGWRSQVLCAVE